MGERKCSFKSLVLVIRYVEMFDCSINLNHSCEEMFFLGNAEYPDTWKIVVKEIRGVTTIFRQQLCRDMEKNVLY